MRSTAEFTMLLRQHGWKVTPQRIAVFEALRDTSSHPTADDVFAAVNAKLGVISLRSVYQSLHELVTLGEARLVHLGPGAARFDLNTADHDHLVCDGCGLITDVVLDRPEVPAAQLGGFLVDSTAVVVRGWCRGCRPPRSPRRRAATVPTSS